MVGPAETKAAEVQALAAAIPASRNTMSVKRMETKISTP